MVVCVVEKLVYVGDRREVAHSTGVVNDVLWLISYLLKKGGVVLNKVCWWVVMSGTRVIVGYGLGNGLGLGWVWLFLGDAELHGLYFFPHIDKILFFDVGVPLDFLNWNIVLWHLNDNDCIITKKGEEVTRKSVRKHEEKGISDLEDSSWNWANR